MTSAPAAWERNLRSAMLAERPRCIGCRRPDQTEMLAWRDGYYAILLPGGGRFAVFDPQGRPLLNDGTAGRRLEMPGWQPIRVELDTSGRCPRCAYFHRHGIKQPTTRVDR